VKAKHCLLLNNVFQIFGLVMVSFPMGWELRGALMICFISRMDQPFLLRDQELVSRPKFLGMLWCLLW